MRSRALFLGALLFPYLGCSSSSESSSTDVADSATTADATGDDTAFVDDSATSDSGTTSDSGATSDSGSATDSATDAPATSWWFPTPTTSWQWQLSGTLDSSFDVKAYDIDLFGTTDAQITALHAAKRKVICYFDTAYEPDRPDSAKLAPYKGNAVKGWPGQYWLDIRKPEVVAVMKDRIALAQTKKCDAIEADDVDSRSNDPGFPISAADQQGFIKTLAAEAHAKGMGYALKNDLDEIGVLLPFVDFAVNEECFTYSECDLLKPFIAAGKAVYQVEYTDGDLAAKGATICPKANALNFDTLIKHLDLGAPRYGCR
ncbi:MAG: endo alpha-1,4 polygalactosaminidase [Polyangiales bacterium]